MRNTKQANLAPRFLDINDRAVELRKAARDLFAAYGVLEEALDIVVEAAKDEFQCRIIFTQPAEIRVDGNSYLWPADNSRIINGS